MVVLKEGRAAFTTSAATFKRRARFVCRTSPWHDEAMPEKIKRHLPLILGGLSAVLLGVIVWQWRAGNGMDWFSLGVIAATLGLLALYLRQD
ncbi:MAG: hypothetical protein WBF53_16070 [Litorimonas sp.]